MNDLLVRWCNYMAGNIPIYQEKRGWGLTPCAGLVKGDRLWLTTGPWQSIRSRYCNHRKRRRKALKTSQMAFHSDIDQQPFITTLVHRGRILSLRSMKLINPRVITDAQTAASSQAQPAFFYTLDYRSHKISKLLWRRCRWCKRYCSINGHFLEQKSWWPDSPSGTHVDHVLSGAV